MIELSDRATALPARPSRWRVATHAGAQVRGTSDVHSYKFTSRSGHMNDFTDLLTTGRAIDRNHAHPKPADHQAPPLHLSWARLKGSD